MSNALNYILRFTLIFVGLSAIYLGLISGRFLVLNLNNAALIVGILAVLFLGGMFIVAPSLSKDPEKFVIRFLLLTTVQMLSVFGSIGVLSFQRIPHVKSIGFHAVSLFCLFLFVQSFLLIRYNNKN
jgi:hypothetical protein